MRVTVCDHVFHSACIDEWCKKNLTCPNCRTDLSYNNILDVRQEKSKKENSSWITSSIEYSDDEDEDEGVGDSARKMKKQNIMPNMPSVPNMEQNNTLNESVVEVNVS